MLSSFTHNNQDSTIFQNSEWNRSEMLKPDSHLISINYTEHVDSFYNK
jgi:hypothetical protein